MINLERGKPYTLPLHKGEGAAAQFLTIGGSVLQLILPDMTAKEEKALRSGMIVAGILYKKSAMLFLFQFYDDNGKRLITFDAPYDIRLTPPNNRLLPNIENSEQRLAIEIHAIDEKKILRAIRLVTMPPEMTMKFLSDVQNQLVSIEKPDVVMRGWMEREPYNLIKKSYAWVLGQ